MRPRKGRGEGKDEREREEWVKKEWGQGEWRAKEGEGPGNETDFSFNHTIL